MKSAVAGGASETGSVVKAEETTVAPQPVHLLYLDGLRGIAAFYVFIHHIFEIGRYTQGDNVPEWLYNLGVIRYGYFAVDVFIVLSGFCLMLPITRGGFKTFPKGISNFLLRRARRILPPYYAALALSIAFVLIFPSVRHLMPPGLSVNNLYDRAGFTGAIISHVFLVHNLWRGFSHRLNGPMWSVATEWQIYFVFAFILLPLRNKLGPLVPIVLGFLFGALTIRFGLDAASFWYVGSFAIGMAASDISFLPGMEDWRKRAPLGVLTAAIVFACMVLFSVFHRLPGETQVVAQDFAVAVGTAAPIAYWAIRGPNANGSFNPGAALNRLLSSPLLVGLGRFSYSLYLIHFPIVCAVLSLSTSLHLNFYQFLAFVTLFVIPVVLGVSYLFYTVFERPFLNTPQSIAKVS